MLNKLNCLALLSCLKFKAFAEELKNDENGMEIVQVVLLILVGVLAIVMVWGFLGTWLGELFDKIKAASL